MNTKEIISKILQKSMCKLDFENDKPSPIQDFDLYKNASEMYKLIYPYPYTNPEIFAYATNETKTNWAFFLTSMEERDVAAKVRGVHSLNIPVDIDQKINKTSIDNAMIDFVGAGFYLIICCAGELENVKEATWFLILGYNNRTKPVSNADRTVLHHNQQKFSYITEIENDSCYLIDRFTASWDSPKIFGKNKVPKDCLNDGNIQFQNSIKKALKSLYLSNFERDYKNLNFEELVAYVSPEEIQQDLEKTVCKR